MLTSIQLIRDSLIEIATGGYLSSTRHRILYAVFLCDTLSKDSALQTRDIQFVIAMIANNEKGKPH